jgi:DNA-binding response OmpR family regulator
MAESRLVVLVVSRKGSAQDDLCHVLSAFGHNAHVLEDGETLIHGLSLTQPDMVVIGDGFVPSDQVSGLRGQFPEVGIVVLTSADNQADSHAVSHLAYYQAGADVCLSQPWHPLELNAVISKLGLRVRRQLALRNTL